MATDGIHAVSCTGGTAGPATLFGLRRLSFIALASIANPVIKPGILFFECGFEARRHCHLLRHPLKNKSGNPEDCPREHSPGNERTSTSTTITGHKKHGGRRRNASDYSPSTAQPRPTTKITCRSLARR